jgi:integrative and conjugative element protein (TIGR02256 family)
VTSFLLLPKAILRTVRVERERHLPLETGGFLIGMRRGPHIEVTALTPQGPGDVATRHSFERSCPSHRERIHSAWRRSDGLESLRGDWHSHPHGPSAASSIDRSAWRILVDTSRLPIIGLVDAGEACPVVYFATRNQRNFSVILSPGGEEPDHFLFAIPAPRS